MKGLSSWSTEKSYVFGLANFLLHLFIQPSPPNPPPYPSILPSLFNYLLGGSSFSLNQVAYKAIAVFHLIILLEIIVFIEMLTTASVFWTNPYFISLLHVRIGIMNPKKDFGALSD